MGLCIFKTLLIYIFSTLMASLRITQQYRPILYTNSTQFIIVCDVLKKDLHFDVVNTNISKAFNRSNHKLLIHKLRSMVKVRLCGSLLTQTFYIFGCSSLAALLIIYVALNLLISSLDIM